MADKVQSIIEEIKTLSLLEASQLVKGLEEAFGLNRHSEGGPTGRVRSAAPRVGAAECRNPTP